MPKITIYAPVPSEWLHDPNEKPKESTVQFTAGKIVGILDNGKLLGFADALEQQLRAAGAKDVVRWTRHYQVNPMNDALISEIKNSVDVAIVGLGN